MWNWIKKLFGIKPKPKIIRKLGKLPARIDTRTLKLSTILKNLPPLPMTYDVDNQFPGFSDKNMFLNNKLGDCVIAARAHMTLRFECFEQKCTIQIADNDVRTEYFKETGGPDSGLNMLDSLNQWRQNGWMIGDKLYKIDAFASVDWKNHDQVKYGCLLFNGIYFGIQVPQSALDQNAAGEPWTVVANDGGIQGGHCVYNKAYSTIILRKIKLLSTNEIGPVCMTWGAPQQMTWGFWDKYCVTPETKILTNDLRWIRADTIKKGDILLAFDEKAIPYRGHGKYCRHWKSSNVESIDSIKRPCYELKFSDGTKVRCSAEHKWLSHNKTTGARWISTENLRCSAHLHSSVVKPVDVWKTDYSQGAGYLAGAFDGEGCLTQRDLTQITNNKRGIGISDVRLTFSQKKNEMFNEVINLLKERDFGFSESANRNVTNINIRQRGEMLRFLGSIRPKRLLPKFNAELLGQMSMKTVKLISKEFIGNQVVIAIKTDTGTYIAEGLASHNCDEAYIVIDALDGWIDPANDPLDISALKQYLVDMGTMPSTRITISTLSLPSGTVGKVYSASLAAAGGVLPYHWTIYAGNLPDGLILSDSGTIVGTPTTAGKYPVTFLCTDSAGNASGVILSIQIKRKCLLGF